MVANSLFLRLVSCLVDLEGLEDSAKLEDLEDLANLEDLEDLANLAEHFEN
jgi:hypothetical protein